MLLRGEKGFYLVDDKASKAMITEYYQLFNIPIRGEDSLGQYIVDESIAEYYRKDKDAFKTIYSHIDKDRLNPRLCLALLDMYVNSYRLYHFKIYEEGIDVYGYLDDCNVLQIDGSQDKILKQFYKGDVESNDHLKGATIKSICIKAPARDCKDDEEYIKEVLNGINSDRQ